MYRSILLGLLVSTPAIAADTYFTHQGRLLDTLGAGISGELTVTLTLYSDSGGTTDVWQKTWTDVSFQDGYYNVPVTGLDDATPTPRLVDAVIGTGDNLWVGVSIEGQNLQTIQRLGSLSGGAAITRQFARYDGNGSSSGGFYNLPSQGRTRGSGLIQANHLSNSGLGNEFEVLQDCWFNFSASVRGNTSHAYSAVDLYNSSGGLVEQLAYDTTHEGSTTGYTFSGSVFVEAGQKIRFRDDYTPGTISGSFFYYTAVSD